MGRIAAWNVEKSAPKAAFGRIRIGGAPNPVRFVVLLVCGVMLSGCLTQGNCLPTTCGGPERLIPIEQDLGPIADSTGYADVLSRYNNAASLDTMAGIRNNFIFERIYAMDVKYTAYEEALTKESESEGFWAAVTNAALTGTGALLPVAQTTRLLSGIAAGLTTVDQAYNKQFLYAKTVQILESQMRAKRADVVSLIVLRAKTPVTQYPLGMAMSDLEEYYRAGTLASAFVDLSESVGTDATQNKKVKDQIKGGGNAVTQAQAQVRAGVITNVGTPLVTPFRTVAVSGPTRIGIVERQMLSKDMKMVLDILCLTNVSDLGIAGSSARKTLASFLTANGKSSSEIVDRNAFADLQDLKIEGKRSCQ